MRLLSKERLIYFGLYSTMIDVYYLTIIWTYTYPVLILGGWIESTGHMVISDWHCSVSNSIYLCLLCQSSYFSLLFSGIDISRRILD